MMRRYFCDLYHIYFLSKNNLTAWLKLRETIYINEVAAQVPPAYWFKAPLFSV